MAFELKSFLNRGAFYRNHQGDWVLGSGERSLKPSLEAGEQGFYAPDFFLEKENSWSVFTETEHFSTGDLQKILERQKRPEMRSTKDIQQLANLKKYGYFRLVDWEWNSANREGFTSSFIKIQGDIQAGKISKAVPLVYEFSKGEMQEDLVKDILHKLLITEDHLTPYGYWDETGGIIGVTPEVLFCKDAKKITTMALAGTRKSDDNGSLLTDEKEMKEHALVIEGLQQSLQALGASIEVGSTQEWNIGLLTHLKTDIQVELGKDISSEEVVRALHPTPALGTYPKEEGMAWLKQQPEGAVRHRYGAPFGFQDASGRGEFFVAIRNLQWDKSGQYIFSGCGVVEASEEESEWQELFAKRTTVKHTLGL